MANIFTVERVSHHRQGHPVLEQISHAFTDGLIHAIIGPNGAGKTSLLRLLGLLEKPGQGQIFFRDLDTTSLWPQCLNLRRRLGFLHQNPLLFQGTVFDNLAVGLKYRQVPRRQRRHLVARDPGSLQPDFPGPATCGSTLRRRGPESGPGPNHGL